MSPGAQLHTIISSKIAKLTTGGRQTVHEYANKESVVYRIVIENREALRETFRHSSSSLIGPINVSCWRKQCGHIQLT